MNVPWQEPQWLGLVLAGLAAFIGWRSKEAVEAVKAKRTEEDVKEIKARLLALEREIHAGPTHQEAENKISKIHTALERIEQRLDGKKDL